MNDLPSRVHVDTRCHLFADDCLLYRVIYGLNDQVQLQSDLGELEQWAADCGMQFNPSKCNVLSVNKQPHHHQHFYKLCSVVLNLVESKKYLVVTHPAICHGVPISPQSARRQIRNLDLSKGI